ncbi:hypothetical protein KJ365_08365 [Glaciecola sp. XM2]|jgi:hypothetical protein|uniref:hypothetical protein n=1 Tax=Glaciecola sp. XM2 TaxID=1914931 RepID=UPI001BDF39F2|nr:hypothetical protein [Glaciecola sp. XM2]MBT1450893.1 hypothetical protein [Glaciecola sp. XM2]
MSIARQQQALLQAMGIDVYHVYHAQDELPALAQKPWFDSLLSFLALQRSDVEFSDSQPIQYDAISKKLILPLTINQDDASLKREIWRNIQVNATDQS